MRNFFGRIADKFCHRDLQRMRLVRIKIKELDTAIAEIAYQPNTELAFLRGTHLQEHVPGLDGYG